MNFIIVFIFLKYHITAGMAVTFLHITSQRHQLQ